MKEQSKVNMNRRDNDKKDPVQTNGIVKISAEEIMREPKVNQCIEMLASTDNRRIILGCGELLRVSDLNLLILSQNANDEKQKEVYSKIRTQVYAILDNLLSEMKSDDFKNIALTERDAFMKVVTFLRERNAQAILLEIALESDNPDIANSATYHFIKNGERDALLVISHNAVCTSARNIASRELQMIN